MGETAQGNFTGGKQDKMSLEMDRRSFLTNSAATIGGVAMAGTVVDNLLAGAAGAATQVGQSTATPKTGGHLTVGLTTDQLTYYAINGQQGNWDAAAYARGNAIYDPLFSVATDGVTLLPMLGLSCTPNTNFTQFTVKLRTGVKFHDGTNFNADAVVANFKGSGGLNGYAAGAAIAPIIGNCVKVDDSTVTYQLLLPFSGFPYILASQQIGFMAAPSSMQLVAPAKNTYTGRPIGTGPFMADPAAWPGSYVQGSKMDLVKNPNYWKQDAKGRSLPYLDSLTFKVLVDPESMYQALQAGTVDLIMQNSNSTTKKILANKSIVSRTDANDNRSPAINSIMFNATSTMSQFGIWAQVIVPSYISAGKAIPAALISALAGNSAASQAVAPALQGTNIVGGVNPDTLKWDGTRVSPASDPTIRKAIAMSLNPATYMKVICNDLGTFANGVYAKNSPYYQDPQYPTYNPKAAKALVDAYKKKNNVTDVKLVYNYVGADSIQTKAMQLFQANWKAIGITLVPNSMENGVLVATAITGQYESTAWSQFGGVDQVVNYVWWASNPAVGPLQPSWQGQEYMLPSWPYSDYVDGTHSPNFAQAVNFAHQNNPAIQKALLSAQKSAGGSTEHVTAWRQVNDLLAQEVTYAWLNSSLTCLAAKPKVQNFMGSQQAGKYIIQQAGGMHLDQAWIK